MQINTNGKPYYIIQENKNKKNWLVKKYIVW